MGHRFHPGTAHFLGNAVGVNGRFHYSLAINERDEGGHIARVETAPLRRERNSPRSGQSLRESGEHHEVGVKADALLLHRSGQRRESNQAAARQLERGRHSRRRS
jgi:hypothetical protein